MNECDNSKADKEPEADTAAVEASQKDLQEGGQIHVCARLTAAFCFDFSAQPAFLTLRHLSVFHCCSTKPKAGMLVTHAHADVCERSLVLLTSAVLITQL